jgi:hypothetical protein
MNKQEYYAKYLDGPFIRLGMFSLADEAIREAKKNKIEELLAVYDTTFHIVFEKEETLKM